MSTVRAKIYQPAKTAMQSGKGKTSQWTLEFERPAPATPDALMGWNTMASTVTQVKLSFATQEEAITYANAKNIEFAVSAPHHAAVAPKAYAENFSSNRRQAFDGDC